MALLVKLKCSGFVHACSICNSASPPSLLHPVPLSVPEALAYLRGTATAVWEFKSGSEVKHTQRPAENPQQVPAELRFMRAQTVAGPACAAAQLQQQQWLQCSLGSAWPLTLAVWDTACTRNPKSSVLPPWQECFLSLKSEALTERCQMCCGSRFFWCSPSLHKLDKMNFEWTYYDSNVVTLESLWIILEVFCVLVKYPDIDSLKIYALFS